MRPHGDIALALKRAAALGPAPTRELCERAQVGYAAGRYTATRMVARGQLVKLGGYGAPLALPEEMAGASADPLAELQARFWRGSQAPATEQAADFSCL